MPISATIHRGTTEAAFHGATASHACNTSAPAGTRIMYRHSQSKLLSLAFDNQYKAQGGETYEQGNQAWSPCHINCEPLTACKQQLVSHLAQLQLMQPAPHQQLMQLAPQQQLQQQLTCTQRASALRQPSQLTVNPKAAITAASTNIENADPTTDPGTGYILVMMKKSLQNLWAVVSQEFVLSC